jgi:hypothetical protein
MAADSGSSIEVGKAGVTVIMTMSVASGGTVWSNPLDVV